MYVQECEPVPGSIRVLVDDKTIYKIINMRNHEFNLVMGPGEQGGSKSGTYQGVNPNWLPEYEELSKTQYPNEYHSDLTRSEQDRLITRIVWGFVVLLVIFALVAFSAPVPTY